MVVGASFKAGMMSSDEVLKAVFPLLDVKDLARCMEVCKQWRDIAKDDYFWKCLCARRWPSICKRPNPTLTYYKLYQTFYKRQKRRKLLPPRLSFDDLEFFIDIWTDDRLIFSEVVPGPALLTGIKAPPPGICYMLRSHLEGPLYRMTLPIQPRFTIPFAQSASVSVLARRKDSNRVACVMNKPPFDYVDRSSCRALAFDYLDFSPLYPFISDTRAWVSLFFLDDGSEGVMDVFGIELDFCDAANSKEEVLWLLDMLDWK
ncbi:F-box protein At5g39250 [Punica granatum]|uniref:F-box protein At5g39250 n=1 Tax=Punica granatum TaxID=22663 RepID=A0A6P8EIJ1_PUNGR|nr:F-box protein At5g39250 [Punica granatum]